MRTRIVGLTAASLAGVLGTVSTVAWAEVSEADLAREMIQVVKADASGDVRHERNSGVLLALRNTIDLSKVTYDVDRTAQTITITFNPRLVIGRDGFKQLFITQAITDDASSMRFFLATNKSSRARYFDPATDEEGYCEGGSSSANRATEQVFLVVPFACLGESIIEGRLQSLSLLEKAGGRDVSSDLTKRTRELPFTAYEAPPQA